MWPVFKWLVFLYFATLLVFDRVVYNLLALLIVSLAFASLTVYRPRWDTEVKTLALVLLANLLLAAPNLILARDGLISLENPLRMLLMIPLILAVKGCGLPARFICSGLAIGMLIASIIISWQYYIEDVVRPGGHYNPILFGQIAMSAFAVLLAGCLVFRDRMSILYFISLLASFYCVVLSGTLGALLAVGPIIIVLLWWKWRSGNLKNIWLSRWTILLPVIVLLLGACYDSLS